MRKIGYARVSTPGQNLDRQIGALRAERCDEVYREKASGKDIRNRPELEKAIDQLGTSDVLVVAEWDRATRSMMDGVHLIERINKLRRIASHSLISRVINLRPCRSVRRCRIARNRRRDGQKARGVVSNHQRVYEVRALECGRC